MSTIRTVTLEVEDLPAAQRFYRDLGIESRIQLRTDDAPTSGFRGVHLSLVVPGPSAVDTLMGTAEAAGADTVKAPKRSMWGYGGVFTAPDGTIWKVVSESKKDTGAASGDVTDLVVLLGVDDVRKSKQVYLERGFEVEKSFGGKYVEFRRGTDPVTFGLLKRRSLAKDAGVDAEGSGSHRIVLGTDGAAFTDPDGFVWQPTP